jgi:hypothetical protein
MRIVATSGDLLAVIRGSSTRAVASSNRRLCGLGLHAAGRFDHIVADAAPVVRLVSNHLLTPCPRTLSRSRLMGAKRSFPEYLASRPELSRGTGSRLARH